MITGIFTARSQHYRLTVGPRGDQVPRPLLSIADYEAAQRQWITARQQQGWPVTIHQVVGTRSARISGGNWIMDCPCGNAPMTDPEWGVAFCFFCGAQYHDVEFPPDRTAIEAVLVQRERLAERHWTDETLEELRAENVAHGDGVPT